ncbi:hypothetical protein SERLA73DRAFT_111270 [Serpula lacrymans var. lacrymans S7.3]|uniref:Oxo-4-hydroxy-4-carboxy-5-ureidoimidazoline decarboxylase domain-containing protein n=2 Tax=Serpula lacrymans var. lacrymans TaxID=341189 RepID=F8Q4Z1_SERL3|nr:uncharacterized protein SERLADRAFT_362572 [Serpula lacrymans var. lacrymans S7.9]EGN96618.1 hypothetical protein SERLA73DRAFT_111270 [Serpula lacrymans var. lacrymans S7.3]EGO22186.1 hypothetical protein SERLADRAFT_362572 [Serpula lacrymans var. lacrymans S7.9]
MDLPPLQSVLASDSAQDAPLARTLSLLFEPSDIIFSHLVPQLVSSRAKKSTITSYSELIDVAIELIGHWDASLRLAFIAGHPRIGETRNLSALSAKEQGGANATTVVTPPEVLRRLAHLNRCYEHKFRGLIYMTFVNGRSRAVIAEEMEDMLGIEHSLSPDEPNVNSICPVKTGEEEWVSELDRAVHDVGRVAKSRLNTLDV